MNKHFKTFALLLALGSACNGGAQATLNSVDYVAGSGDGWLTRDSASGLDWLDVNLTVNQNFEQVLFGNWYAQGFRFATRSELSTLFTHAGVPDDGFNVMVTHPQQTLTLVKLLGPTFETYNRLSAYGFIGTDFFGNAITPQNYTGTFNALLGKTDYITDISDIGDIGEAHFTGGAPFSNQASPDYGSFLVRVTPVPEPESAAMLIAGLGIVGVAARRKARA